MSKENPGKLRIALREMKNYALYSFTFPDKDFSFNCEKYKYIRCMTNYMYNTERVVEVPITLREIERCREKSNGDILEVGNVLNHYSKIDHTVVDKYEKYPGVINHDIAEYSSNEKYDLIVSISTLEHVGFDEQIKENDKTLKAVENMKRLLKPNGKLFIIIPLGYNKYLDNYLKTGELEVSEMWLMHRISENNNWVEEPIEKLFSETIEYGNPYLFGNWLLIFTILR